MSPLRIHRGDDDPEEPDDSGERSADEPRQKARLFAVRQSGAPTDVVDGMLKAVQDQLQEALRQGQPVVIMLGNTNGVGIDGLGVLRDLQIVSSESGAPLAVQIASAHAELFRAAKITNLFFVSADANDSSEDQVN